MYDRVPPFYPAVRMEFPPHRPAPYRHDLSHQDVSIFDRPYFHHHRPRFGNPFDRPMRLHRPHFGHPRRFRGAHPFGPNSPMFRPHSPFGQMRGYHPHRLCNPFGGPIRAHRPDFAHPRRYRGAHPFGPNSPMFRPHSPFGPMRGHHPHRPLFGRPHNPFDPRTGNPHRPRFGNPFGIPRFGRPHNPFGPVIIGYPHRRPYPGGNI